MDIIRLPNTDVADGAYDLDIIWDTDKYLVTYTTQNGGRHFKTAQCATFNGQYTQVADIVCGTAEGVWEGSVFTRIGGKLYFTHAKGGNNLAIRDPYTLAEVQSQINVDRWLGGSPPPWGFIVPVPIGNKTYYYGFFMTSRKPYFQWNGSAWVSVLYAYGDLIIFKAKETWDGQEYPRKGQKNNFSI
jgi:hypothetical protein